MTGSGSSNGIIKSFNSKTGYGFISQTDAQEDIFLGKEQLPVEWQSKGLRIENMAVTFEVTNTLCGKSQARNVRPVLPPKAGSVVSGMVKSWNPTKGFGFFAVDRLDEDVFFTKDCTPMELRTWDLDGVLATFILQQKANGKYEAANVVFGRGHGDGLWRDPPVQDPHASITLAATPQQQRASVVKVRAGSLAYLDTSTDAKLLIKMRDLVSLPTESDKKRLQNHQQTEQGQSGLAMLLVDGKTYRGQVKSFNKKQNCGFIVCPPHEGDLWFHCNDVVTPGQGAGTAAKTEGADLADSKTEKSPKPQRSDLVSFVARLSPQGRMQASKVMLCANVDTSFLDPMRKQTLQNSLLEEVKMWVTHLNVADLSEMAFFATQMLQSKLRAL